MQLYRAWFRGVFFKVLQITLIPEIKDSQSIRVPKPLNTLLDTPAKCEFKINKTLDNVVLIIKAIGHASSC